MNALEIHALLGRIAVLHRRGLLLQTE